MYGHMDDNEQQKQMTDFLGKELAVGDDVAFMQVRYRNLLRGKIAKISPVKATISFVTKDWKGNECVRRTFQESNQIIKI